MSTEFIRHVVFGLGCGLMLSLAPAWGDEPLPKATIDGTGPGWRELGEADFVNVNTAPDTWTWKDGTVHCKGTPVGVTRSQKQITNFEMVAMRRQLGNLRLGHGRSSDRPEAKFTATGRD